MCRDFVCFVRVVSGQAMRWFRLLFFPFILVFWGELSPSICTGCVYLIYSEVYEEGLHKTMYREINVAQEYTTITGLQFYRNPFVRSKYAYREAPLQNTQVTSETAAFD